MIGTHESWRFLYLRSLIWWPTFASSGRDALNPWTKDTALLKCRNGDLIVRNTLIERGGICDFGMIRVVADSSLCTLRLRNDLSCSCHYASKPPSWSPSSSLKPSLGFVSIIDSTSSFVTVVLRSGSATIIISSTSFSQFVVVVVVVATPVLERWHHHRRPRQ